MRRSSSVDIPTLIAPVVPVEQVLPMVPVVSVVPVEQVMPMVPVLSVVPVV